MHRLALKASSSRSRVSRRQLGDCCGVTGEIDVATAGLLRSAIHGAATDHQHVELDLSAVTFCDVVGASAIEQAQRQLEARGCQLTLQGTDGSLHRLLAVEGLFSTLQRLALLDGQQPPRPGRTSRRSTRMD